MQKYIDLISRQTETIFSICMVQNFLIDPDISIWLESDANDWNNNNQILIHLFPSLFKSLNEKLFLSFLFLSLLVMKTKEILHISVYVTMCLLLE